MDDDLNTANGISVLHEASNLQMRRWLSVRGSKETAQRFLLAGSIDGGEILGLVTVGKEDSLEQEMKL